MSDIPADWRGQLDLRAEIARIDRDRAEAAKLQEEVRKFAAEQHKLTAETAKFERERKLLPWSLAIAVATGVVITGLQMLAHIAGWWR